MSADHDQPTGPAADLEVLWDSWDAAQLLSAERQEPALLAIDAALDVLLAELA